MPAEAIVITPQLSIPLVELHFSFVHSSGPGGQKVNKSNTRAELRFTPSNSSALNEEHRRRLEEGLASRLSKEGVLSIRSDKYRTQFQNKRDCLEKFAALVAALLKPPPPKRRPTRPTRAAAARRRRDKELHGKKKKMRQRPIVD